MSVTTAPARRRTDSTRRRRRHAPNPPIDTPREKLDPFSAIMLSFVEREKRRYAQSGVRIGSSGVVHRVGQVPWLLGFTLPAPECHSGFAVTLARMAPAPGAVVTCKRCLSVRHGTRTRHVDGQLSLW